VHSADAEARQLLRSLRPNETPEWVAGPLSEAEWAHCERVIAGRRRGEPLQHLLGEAPFYGLSLQVGPGVLIPRPETETLVELVLHDLSNSERPHVLDVGTGSGAIALAVKAERPDAQVLASDVSNVALGWAERNVRATGLDVQLAHSDLLSSYEVATFAATCHIMVSNPPYLPEGDWAALPAEVQHDPAGALVAGPDGLAVARRLWRQAREHLKPGALPLERMRVRTRTWSDAFVLCA
jgi:release factor glutamine methyltransferase